MSLQNIIELEKWTAIRVFVPEKNGLLRFQWSTEY